MNCRITSLAMALTLTLVQAAAAESTAALPDKAADLAAIMANTRSDPFLERVVSDLQMNFANAPEGLQGKREIFIGTSNILQRVPNLQFPINIGVIRDSDLAQRRARLLSGIMVADLNGDWQVTRAELKDALMFDNLDIASQAFLAGDIDIDNILSTEEIRQIVASGATQDGFQRNGRDQRNDTAFLFDLDGDGVLSTEEIDRCLLALGP